VESDWCDAVEETYEEERSLYMIFDGPKTVKVDLSASNIPTIDDMLRVW